MAWTVINHINKENAAAPRVENFVHLLTVVTRKGPGAAAARPAAASATTRRSPSLILQRVRVVVSVRCYAAPEKGGLRPLRRRCRSRFAGAVSGTSTPFLNRPPNRADSSRVAPLSRRHLLHLRNVVTRLVTRCSNFGGFGITQADCETTHLFVYLVIYDAR